MPGIILGSVSSAPSTSPVTNGELWAWGAGKVSYYYYGVLGINNTYQKSSPVQVGTLTTWSSISTNPFRTYAFVKYSPADSYSRNQIAAGINTSGQLFTWGGYYRIYLTVKSYNSLNLGHGDGRIPRSSPIQVGTGTNWSKVSVAGQTTAAIKTDGTLWIWGWNAYGQLGIAVDTDTRTSPVQVGTGTNWSEVSVGKRHVIALKTDGTIWAWGYNGVYSPALGLGDIVSRSSPVQIGSGTNWSKISAGAGHSAAIKTDGTLWTWGENKFGSLGTNNLIYRSSPVQVGTDTNWSKIECGYYNTFAIKTDGTSWSWGKNGSGILGQNDIINRSSPVQIGNLTNWSKISRGSQHCLALKTDGTIWSWGAPTYGILGQNDPIGRSSPSQIGSLNTWIDVHAGFFSSFAIKS